MKTFNDQLNLRLRHPEFQEYLDFNESESRRVRNQYSCHLDIAYGNDTLQKMDIFPSSVSNSPILVFIHGGYWKALDKNSYDFMAETFIKHQFTVCIINYRLLPKVDMASTINDIKKAVHWIQKEALHYNGNPNVITLSGHSAGGHLALITYLLNENLQSSIKAICSLSGIFNLAPIRESYLNDVLQLNEEDVKKFSPLNKDLSIIKCPVLFSVGSNETKFFINESKNIVFKNKANKLLNYYKYNDLNHYQIVHQLGNEDSPLAQFILRNEPKE